MTRLLINGRYETIPPFPHHKEYIYRCKKFFFSKTPLGQMSIGHGLPLRETWRGFKHKTMLPRDLMIDPTSRCNLRCKGCWAADYDRHDDVSFNLLDDLLTQAESLGIPDCLMTGGEPLMRKNDILRLAEKHRQTTFGLFTNGTLVDESLADKLALLGNINLFLSIEGWREQTDARRGKGVFDQVVKAMACLKSREIGFGFSICYHQKNYLEVSSLEFLDFLRQQGAWFGWLFQYIPIGTDADIGLVLTPQQRLTVKARIDDYSKKHKMVLIDFWNNGHLSYGCVGGGSGFLHINAHGDVEPCAFCHYADVNIHEVSLKQALQSDFLRRFRQAQPFSNNSLTCCPVIDHTDQLAVLVKETKAQSTHLGSMESPEKLAEKTRPAAIKWKPAAEIAWSKLTAQQKRNFRAYIGYLNFKKKFCDQIRPDHRPVK